MKIKSLSLHGFKSFADRTEVDFHEGMTAIVGPNGCGKSNISDAIRWVLGEQAPSAIRGSRMEEAIFGGTEERRPISRAEVSLTLSNADGTLPVPYSEVVIGRTVYRGGESEYRLNGEVCRLRDIQDLCRDTGLGATEYSIIEGRMIDAILSDRAEERRALFEEAAEIGKYKDRRKTALRRLDQAEADLERLEDVMGEVRTKVRSLAQQRGRAERYRDYRERRLRLEVGVAEARLRDLQRREREAEGELERLRAEQPAEEGELQTRETRAETLRVEIAERERERNRKARELADVRERLERRERRRMLASERQATAERRLETVAGELASLGERVGELEARTERLEQGVEEERAAVRELAEREEELKERAVALRQERDRRREEEAEAEERRAEMDREIRLLEADREAAASRIEERGEELDRRREELSEARSTAEEAAEAAEEARLRAAESGERLGRLEEELEEAQELHEDRRRAVRELRDRIGEIEGDLSGRRARARSLTGLLESGEDLPPGVSRLLEADLPGVLGVLADAVKAPGDLTGAVEASLGSYLHGVLVDDWDAVVRVRAWLGDRDDEEGLLLLPVDPGPRLGGTDAPSGGDLLEAIDVADHAAAWVRTLLGDVDRDAADQVRPKDGPWTAPDGTGQDRVGAVRLGRPAAVRGTLERRSELEGLRARISEQEEELDGLRRELAEGERALDDAGDRVEGLEEELSEAGKRLREAEAAAESARERERRARREIDDLDARIGQLEVALEASEDAAAAEEGRLDELREDRAEALAEHREAEERARAAEADWERARSELHELQLQLARREGDLSSAEDRLRSVRSTLRDAERRRERLQAEREEQRGVLKEAGSTLEESEETLEELFDRRRELESAMGELDEELEGRKERLEELETWLREARRTEREHAERRHELELELAEVRGKRGNIRERLEGEWEEPPEDLLERVEPPEEGDLEAWSEELEEVRRKLARLGPVNLLAAEEYEEERERLDFLEEQKEDLLEARDHLHDSILRINESAAEAFEETFGEIRENFQSTFQALFEGGECDVWLEDEEDPLDSPIEISASPRGKRTQRIHLLSGGERALTALALLFAIYLAKPSPFCIMDEVDAPLDETNILRFVGMLDRFKQDTQFIVITHNPRTIESADWIYGVTMQEPGVSSVVGVEFSDLPQGQVA